ncbi:MAG TPA: hypothetical protein DDW18_01210 [Firmicutes bacterium]|mgnify:FL=1|nr:hypothetical protein [Bacillota bacterium]
MSEKKKENGFTKFFQKVGKSISDANRESKLENAYTKDARKFSIYEDDSTFGGISKYGKILDETHVELYGELKDNDIPFSSVLVIEPKDKDKELPKFFYVVAKKHDENDLVSLKIKEKEEEKEVENEYKRPVTILTLDPGVQEVQVIKVNKKYFLRKEESK